MLKEQGKRLQLRFTIPNIPENRRNVERMLKQSLKAFKLFQHRFNFASTHFNTAERGWQTLSTLPFNKIERMLKQMLKPFARAFTTVLTVTPFPSVPRDHVWSMLIRAMVVDDFGIAPYWFPQITSRTAGLMTSSTTNSFSTLETQDVSEISLKSFFRSSMGFFLGRGGTLAIFQMVGNRCSRYDALRIYVMGKARMSEYSFKSQFGTLSGPDALH